MLELDTNSLLPSPPQQNGIVERKNRVIQGMVQAMLHGKSLATHFWSEELITICYTINKVYRQLGMDKTPYKLWKEKKPMVIHFYAFGSKCYILCDRENLEKIDFKSMSDSFWVTLRQAKLFVFKIKERRP